MDLDHLDVRQRARLYKYAITDTCISKRCSLCIVSELRADEAAGRSKLSNDAYVKLFGFRILEIRYFILLKLSTVHTVSVVDYESRT